MTLWLPKQKNGPSHGKYYFSVTGNIQTWHVIVASNALKVADTDSVPIVSLSISIKFVFTLNNHLMIQGFCHHRLRYGGDIIVFPTFSAFSNFEYIFHDLSLTDSGRNIFRIIKMSSDVWRFDSTSSLSSLLEIWLRYHWISTNFWRYLLWESHNFHAIDWVLSRE